MNIWQFQAMVTRRLLRWSVFSMVAGVLLSRRDDKFWRGVGTQFVGWGLIDAMIALFGRWQSRRRQAQLDDPLAPAHTQTERRNLSRMLWINAGLDVLYVLGGRELTRRPDDGDRSWRGHGWGIIVQGVFLFFFDVIHALRMPPEDGNW